jgi:hypothetical protein
VGAATIVALGAFALLSLRDGGPDGTVFSPIAQAAERTANAPGVRVEGTGSVTGPGLTMNMQIAGEFGGDRSAMRMDVQSNAASPVAAQMSPMIVVQDGLTMYMSAPLFTGQLPDGKSWMKLDLSEVASLPEAPSAVDARGMLEQLQASGEVTRLGTERVRGVKTTRYAAAIDSADAAAQARAQGDDLAAEIIERSPGISTSEVWIDRRGYVRRIAARAPFAMAGGPGSEMSMTMDFFDFGIEPEISVPADDEAFDATDLALEGIQAQLDAG